MSDNKKAVVIYKSRTGFTKNYAQWIAEDLKCDIFTVDKVKAADLSKYDTIIYGGGLYASGIGGIKLIKKNFNLLKAKKLIVFAVGATPVKDGLAEELKADNFNEGQREKIHFYYLRGGFDYNRLTPFFKLLMNLKKIQVKHSKNADCDTKGFLASYEHPLDLTRKKNVEPIVKYVTED